MPNSDFNLGEILSCASITTGYLAAGYGATILCHEGYYQLKQRFKYQKSSEFCSSDEFLNQESIKNIRRAASIIFMGFAMICFGVGYLKYFNPIMNVPKPPIPLDPREEEAKKIFGPGILKLDKEDPRPKLIYLVGQEDNAFTSPPTQLDTLSPETKALGNWHLIEKLDQTHDIHYKVTRTGREMCATIAEDAKNHLIKSIIIQAKGDPHSITLSPYNTIYLRHNTFGRNLFGIDKRCFSGMSSDGEIILMADETGGNPRGIASAFAHIAKRGVWAPLKKLGDSLVQFSSDTPPKPEFSAKSDEAILNFYINDITCKFLPDGSNICPTWHNVKNAVTDFFSFLY